MRPLAVLSACLGAILLYLIAGGCGFGGKIAGALVYPLCAVAAGLAALVALAAALLGGAGAGEIVLPVGLPWLATHLRLDALSAAFLLILNLVAALVSVFARGHGRHAAETPHTLPVYPVFLAAMNLVIIADDAYSFLIGWELMSLSSWLLVLANHRQAGTRHAAYVYLVMASLGAAALLLAFGILGGPAGDYAFAAMRQAPPTALAATAVFLLVLVGAGSKAGIVPLHAWLPLAHPAAPSHVSALMSGAMTKVAVYALIRFLFDLLGTPQWWWGGIVLVLGAASALLGILSATMQRDLKTLLAYSTVENIGIIAVGLGLALAFQANRMPALAALALLAALFHVYNHALFKSLLFLGAGAVLTATGERDMEHLGGLIHRMPVTALAFLVGAVAISALPPLNGFASEWLIFQAILNGAALPQWLMKFAVPVVGLVLALSAALAALCFVKAFGITFLGRPRSAAAGAAAEVPGIMLAPMLGLALICLVLGVVPGAVIALLRPVAAELLDGGALPFGASSALWLVPLAPTQSSYSGAVLLLIIALLVMLLVQLIHRFASRAVRRAPAWDCGFPDARPQTQYTASSFAQPIRRIFGTTVFAARERVDMPAPGEVRAAGFTMQLRDLAWEWFYAPVAALVGGAADRLDGLQHLTIRRYLALTFAALVLLLAIVAVAQ